MMEQKEKEFKKSLEEKYRQYEHKTMDPEELKAYVERVLKENSF